MTTTNKAGRELDALVAEQVMGWRRGNTAWGQMPWYPTAATHGGRMAVPEFSTDIAAAWQVVEALLTRGIETSLFRDADGVSAHLWRARTTRPVAKESAGTAPLAICLAALAAVEADHA